MENYKNKYRILSHRKPNWDYSANALYFLTIVTQQRICNLGEIIPIQAYDGVYLQMKLSDFGKIVQTQWLQSFKIRNELILHNWVLMPNHIHAIVEIYNSVDTHGNVEPHGRVALPTPTNQTNPINLIEPINFDKLPLKRNAPIRLPKSISSFMAGFKSAVNAKINDYIDENQLLLPKYNRTNHFFQPNYHDHIIRNNFEYQNISNYITNNPLNWDKDTFYNNI